MAIPTNHDTSPYQPPDARWLFLDAHPDKTPASEPGLVVTATGATAIRSSIYRPQDYVAGDTPQVQDAIALIDSVTGAPYGDLDRRLIGMEGEMFVLDIETGEEVPVEGIGAEEFQRSQIEANSEAAAEPSDVVTSLHNQLWLFTEALRRKIGRTAAIDPASAFMHRLPEDTDVRWNNPYMARIADLLPQSVEFIGSGIHMHVDVPTEHAPLIANYVRLIAPYLNLPLQAAPFAFKDTRPRLGEVYGYDPAMPYDGKAVQSVRYPSRAARLDYGGVGIKTSHDTLEGALRQSERRLLSGESNHPARLYGSHADVRIRFDAVDDDRRAGTARIEVCVFDTGAYRFESITAVTELLKATVERIESCVSDGEMGVERLHRAYPGLFGNTVGTDTITQNLHQTEKNSLAMAYDGFEATVKDYKGQTRRARELFWNLYAFAYNGQHTNLAAHKPTFERAAIDRQSLERFITSSSGEVPSLYQYYETGVGTAADWIRAHHEALQAQAVPDADRWRLGAADRMQSLRFHLARTATGLLDTQ